MTTIRILQIASGDLWAGAEVQFYNLCRKLHASPDIELKTVILNNGVLSDELNRAGVDVTVLDEGILSSFSILIRLAGIVRRYRPHIMHSHRLKETVLTGLASLLFPATKCIVTIHGASETPFRPGNMHKAAYKAIERLLVAFRFKKKVYVSHELRSRLERATGEKCRVIENGIDIGQTFAKARLRCDVPSSLGGKRHIAFLGRLVPVKRPDLLLEIVERTSVLKKLPYIFHVIGGGPLYGRLRAEVDRKGLSGYVQMHGFQPNPLSMLAGMNCLLITSDHEGLPTNLLEAMCLGVPIVAHAVGEIPRVLQYGELGILVDSQEPEHYADALRACCSAPASESAKYALQRRVNDHYSADINAGRYIHLYREILFPERSRKPRPFNIANSKDSP